MLLCESYFDLRIASQRFYFDRACAHLILTCIVRDNMASGKISFWPETNTRGGSKEQSICCAYIHRFQESLCHSSRENDSFLPAIMHTSFRSAHAHSSFTLLRISWVCISAIWPALGADDLFLIGLCVHAHRVGLSEKKTKVWLARAHLILTCPCASQCIQFCLRMHTSFTPDLRIEHAHFPPKNLHLLMRISFWSGHCAQRAAHFGSLRRGRGRAHRYKRDLGTLELEVLRRRAASH